MAQGEREERGLNYCDPRCITWGRKIINEGWHWAAAATQLKPAKKEIVADARLEQPDSPGIIGLGNRRRKVTVARAQTSHTGRATERKAPARPCSHAVSQPCRHGRLSGRLGR